MPKESLRSSGTMKVIVYGENELPQNVKSFLRYVKSEDMDIKVYDYEEIEELDTGEKYNELNFNLSLDTEKFVKNEYPDIEEFKNSFDSLAKIFSIDRVYFYTEYKNKLEFAKKFLKDFKSYMKSSDSGDMIHSVSFEVANKRELSIRIIRKKDNRYNMSNTTIKQLAKEYLKSKGYHHIHVYIPN